MSIHITLQHGHCLVTVTLQGFTDEQLAYELVKRKGLPAAKKIATRAAAEVERNLVFAQIRRMIDSKGSATNDVSFLQEAFHLAECDPQALIEAVEGVYNYPMLLKQHLGLTVLDPVQRAAIGHALANSEGQDLVEALLSAVDESTARVWRGQCLRAGNHILDTDARAQRPMGAPAPRSIAVEVPVAETAPPPETDQRAYMKCMNL